MRRGFELLDDTQIAGGVRDNRAISRGRLRARGRGPAPLGLVLFGVALAGTARAQPTADTAAAQGLFDEARTLIAAGKAAEACPKLEESQRLDPGSGTLLNLAKCYEETKRIATAWSTYLEAASAARASNNPGRETTARELAAALAPRVSKLVVEVPPEARLTGLEIHRDGAVMGSAQWGLAIPADEGEHTVSATAPGHKEWKSVTTVVGEGTTAKVTVAPLELAPVETGTTAGTEPAKGLGTQRILAIVAGGVGVIGVGVGTIFGLKSSSDHSEAEKYCNGSVCKDPRGVTAGNDAHSAGNVSTIGMIIGVAGLAGGAALWFTAPGKAKSTQVGVGVGGAEVRGVF